MPDTIERTSAGFQIVLPGCERRTIPKSDSRADDSGQALMPFYEPPSLQETLKRRAEQPMQPKRSR